MPPHPTAKPSWGWLRVGVRKPRLVFAEIRATWKKVTATPRSYWRGCPAAARRSARHDRHEPTSIFSANGDDDDELNINPPTPCQIGKRPPAPKPKENWPAFRESQVEGSFSCVEITSPTHPRPQAVQIGWAEEALWEGVLLPALLPAYNPRSVFFSGRWPGPVGSFRSTAPHHRGPPH